MPQNHIAELLDETLFLTKEDLCRITHVEAAWIDALVEQGALAQHMQDHGFTLRSITTIRKARRLEQDFALNMPGIALALDLLEEIENLRAALARAR